MKSLVSALAVTALAGSAFGLGETLDRTSHAVYNESNLPDYVTVTKTPIDGRIDTRAQTTVFDNVGGGSGFLASPAASGSLGVEDYVTTLGDGASDGVDGSGNATFSLLELGFVGGVQQAGGTIFFDFFHSDFSAATGFGVSFTSPGNFIYTISINNPGATQVPVEGLLLLTADTGTTGQWFLSDQAFAAGSSGDWFDGGKFFDYGAPTGVQEIDWLSRLDVPTPGAAALFGIAGLAGIRRRR